ncbi:MAG: hypothetical protein U9N34_06305 [Candidatus Cloacimonadota bacterium]|nr:hypothetical protein [Candidatus Cloacimonadota bacterium]
MKYNVKTIAEMFGVTKMGVYYWLDGGLPYEIKREIGKKDFKVIDPEDVCVFKGLNKEQYIK